MVDVLNASKFLSNESLSSSIYFEVHKIPKMVAYCLLFLISIVGNSLIVWIIYKDNRLRTTTNYLVANMAVSDFLSALFFVPRLIVDINFDNRWLITNDFGLALCKLCVFIPDTSAAVSMYSCVFIAIDRYYAVAHPLQGGFTRSRLKYIIPGIWIFSSLIVSPSLYYFRLINFQDNTFCLPYDRFYDKLHLHFLMVLIIDITLPVIATIYILIVYKLRRHKVPGNQSDLARRRREQQNKKVLKMSVAIVTSLTLSWLLYSIVGVLVMERKLLKTVHVDNLSFASQFLTCVSYAYNFFIYVIFNDIYRDNVKGILTRNCCWICHCKKKQIRDATGADGQELDDIR